MSFQGFEIPAEYVDDKNDYGQDYVDEDQIMGRSRRGGNKSALKSAKGLTTASTAPPRATANQPLKQEGDPASLKKPGAPRFLPGVDATMSDWEMKLKISADQQKSGGNYALESTTNRTTKAQEKTTDSKSIELSKSTPPTGDGPAVRVENGVRMRPRPVPKKDAEKEVAGKAVSAWDEKDPWA